MAGNDNFEDDYRELFDDTLNQYERSQSKQISDNTEKTVPPASRFTKDKKTNKKPITQGQKTGIMFMFGGLLIIAIGIIDYVDFKKTQRVKKQVEAFEKTLPADYLEYKQAVEHYRDSLMHAKGRSK
jgi:hypothetical protein